jgi:hypothetical protein
MTSLAVGRSALLISVAAALLTDCDSRSSAGSANAVPPQARQTVTRSTSGALLYASNGYNVDVFSYPKGSSVGQLSGFDSGFSKEGLCTDGAGDVFVAGYLNSSNTGQVYEFAHGATTPIAKLSEDGFARACAVDPTTGNLAVSNEFTQGTSKNAGSVAIFADAQGAPTYYYGPTPSRFNFTTYDDAGNLFVSGVSSGELIELPSGSTSFSDVSVSSSPWVSSLQWFGGKLAVSAWTAHVHMKQPDYIDRVKVSNGNGTVVGTTTLSNDEHYSKPDVGQFWIDGSHVVGSGSEGRQLEMWRYPAGGNPTKIVSKAGGWIGVTVSR